MVIYVRDFGEENKSDSKSTRNMLSDLHEKCAVGPLLANTPMGATPQRYQQQRQQPGEGLITDTNSNSSHEGCALVIVAMLSAVYDFNSCLIVWGE